ncbi:hypothetical protein [Kitasatospora sp. NPDC101183]|uniref:hypothetical protein n=1 Tax=Kitasatospora sp. NPDC101183 TaxID=3364100 RepID=UPI0037FAFF63
MPELFRFVALRAPERQPAPTSIDLGTQSTFQKELRGIHGAKDDPLRTARTIAGNFVAGKTFGPGFIAERAVIPQQDRFDQFAVAAAAATGLAGLDAAVQAAFGAPAATVVAQPWFIRLAGDARDTIVARIILPQARSYAVAELARLVRLTALVERVAAADAGLTDAEAIAAALNAVLLLPTPAFPLRTDLPQPVGVGDLLVVKQQLIRYEPGDIAKIENILRGEKRSKVDVHDLTTDTTTVTESSKTTETTTSLDVTERFELKSEVSNVVKEDLAVNAGLSVSATYGGVQINANANVSYSLSKQQSSTVSADHAKSVTTRAATRVTETTRREEIARTIEKLREREGHSFENTAPGNANVSGVYQWLNKVYQAQVFNYGKRLLFDLTVPEPAAFVHAVIDAHALTAVPVPPEPFVLVQDPGAVTWRPVAASDLGPDGRIKETAVTRPLTPADLDPDPTAPTYFGLFVGKFGAVGVNAPPEPTTTVSQSLSGAADDHKRTFANDDISVPQGYQVSDIAVNGGFVVEDNDPIDGDELLTVVVGKQTFEARGAPQNLTPRVVSIPVNGSADAEEGSLPIAVEATQARDYAIAIDVTCACTDAWRDQWRIDTYTALLNAHNDLVGTYEDAVKAQQIKAATAVSLGDNPAQNRTIEQAELKKACVSRLTGTDLYAAAFDDVNAAQPDFPRPNVPPASNPQIAGGDQEAFIRFFEEVFEWENMQYLFYPYFWGRSLTWHDKAVSDNPDPLFAEFLKAGAARVVIPVRPQLEGDLRYFLMTGQLWGGGAMPEITDSDYLPITQEIQDRDNAPGDEVPQGPSWEVELPTALIQLRADDTLPSWREFTYQGHGVWVPGRIVGGAWKPDYGTLDANGDWTP